MGKRTMSSYENRHIVMTETKTRDDNHHYGMIQTKTRDDNHNYGMIETKTCDDNHHYGMAEANMLYEHDLWCAAGEKDPFTKKRSCIINMASVHRGKKRLI